MFYYKRESLKDIARTKGVASKNALCVKRFARESLEGIARTKGIVCKKVLSIRRYHEQICRLPYFRIKHKQYYTINLDLFDYEIHPIE